MSLHRVNPEDIEVFTLQTHPSRTFISSSMGVTGVLNVFPRASTIEKESQPLSQFNRDQFNDDDTQQLLTNIQNVTSSNIASQMAAYLDAVNATNSSVRKQQTVDITRFEPSVSFSRSTQKKNVIKNTLYPYYRCSQPTLNWAYTNYHTLNFFTSSAVPSNTVLLYPSSASVDFNNNFASGSYALDRAFTFEFYINPRYTTDGPFDSFRAGTIYHLSSSYAVSMITGSSRNSMNRPDGFRLVLQVLNGATVAPSSVTTSTPLCFISDDNALRLNKWHHVGIRWASDVNSRTGSFVVDGDIVGTFVIPSASIKPAAFTGSGNPDVLCIGNFYEGNNSGNNQLALFFNQNISRREGLVQLTNDGSATRNTPDVFSFNHPLNAEVHELKIHNRYIPIETLLSSSRAGSTQTGSIIFYVPPFFTKQSPNREPYGTNVNGWLIGGVMQTPFFSITGSTEDPFNVALSFGVSGRVLNLENFTRDFITNNHPRLLHLSGVEIGETTSTALSANALLYDEQTNYNSGSIRKRNLTVLPNDNGRFIPNYGLLFSGSTYGSGSIIDRFKNDLGNTDYSLISLNEMIGSGSLFSGLIFDSGSFFSGFAGATPEDPGVDPGSVLTILQRTRDTSSNEVVFFDVSNLYYGKRIDPNSLSIIDEAITGSGGKVKMTLRDNGNGSIYRADCSTTHAVWNNIGDVFYNEGIAVIKTPNIPFFGKDQFEMTFKGEQNIHVMRLNIIAPAGAVNSSSNPSFTQLTASNLAHETETGFVYLTGLNFLDDNLNVIMRSKFAQPIIKRTGDRLAVRTKLDF